MTDAGSESRLLAEAIAARRTVHEFRAEVPPRDVVLAGLELARWAPNHRLTEPWHFHLLGPRTQAAVVELNARMVEADRGAEAARKKRERWARMPGWLVVTSERHERELVERENYAACCCAVQNLSLYLWARGIGMKWGTGAVTRDPRFFELLGVDPARVQVVGLFWYGYPARVPVQKRRELDLHLTELP